MKQTRRQATSARKVVLAIGVIFGAMSIVFVIIGLRLIELERIYDAESATVDGIIASKRVDEKNGIAGDSEKLKAYLFTGLDAGGVMLGLVSCSGASCAFGDLTSY